MDRRVFVSTMVGGVLAAAPSGARAQQAGKAYRIGMLERTSPTTNAAGLEVRRNVDLILPRRTPTKLELSINLEIPPSLLQRADQVIE